MKTLKDALEVMKHHAKLDLLVQGRWLGGKDQGSGLFKGCFFGCAMQTEDDPIEKFCELYGMPLWVGHLSEAIFEGLPNSEAAKWPVELLETMSGLPNDFDYEEARHKLAILRLTKLFDENEGEAKAAIKGVIDCHKNPNDANFKAAELAARSAARSVWSVWSARSAESARSAARSAESATWSSGSAESADSAARSAESATWSSGSAESADSAARSAESATWSSGSARSAAWSVERDNLLSVLRTSK